MIEYKGYLGAKYYVGLHCVVLWVGKSISIFGTDLR